MRSDRFDATGADRFDADAVIVGSGIQGASFAYEMARRGLRPIVIERERPAARNTGASLGILHGGLRYLQRLDASRWLRSRREQSWWLRHFPATTQPLRCLMPLYRGGVRSPAMFAAAFAAERVLQSLLPGALPAGRLVGRAAVGGYPIEQRHLIDVAQWNEGLVVDAQALVEQLLAAARRRGAMTLTAEASGLLVEGRALTGLSASARNGRLELRAPHVIVCAGAATRLLARRLDRDCPKLSSATLAFNLLFDAPGPEHALALSPVAGRGRSLFVRADSGRLLAGTWYAPWPQAAASDDIVVPVALIESAIDELRKCLPGLGLDAARLLGVRAGLLPDRDGSGGTLRERDVVIDHQRRGGPRGLWSVLGPKLTTARALSERVVARIWPHCATVAEPEARETLGAMSDLQGEP